MRRRWIRLLSFALVFAMTLSGTPVLAEEPVAVAAPEAVQESTAGVPAAASATRESEIGAAPASVGNAEGPASVDNAEKTAPVGCEESPSEGTAPTSVINAENPTEEIAPVSVGNAENPTGETAPVSTGNAENSAEETVSASNGNAEGLTSANRAENPTEETAPVSIGNAENPAEETASASNGSAEGLASVNCSESLAEETVPVSVGSAEESTKETAPVSVGNAEAGRQPADAAEASAGENPPVAESAAQQNVSVSGLTLSATAAELRRGETLTIEAAVSPADATSAAVRWESSAPSVATVTDGRVEAVAPGRATIACVALDDESIRAACEVTVSELRAERIEPERAEWTLGVKETASVSGWKLYPEGAEAQVTYASSAPRVAAVDAAGKVTAKRTGTAQITITADSGASCTVSVTVRKAPSSIKLSLPVREMGAGEAVQAEYRLSSRSAGQVRFSSSDDAVATVDAGGLVRAVGAGKCTISVRTYNGRKSKVKLTVKAAPTRAKFAEEALVLGTGDVRTPSVDFGANAMAKATYASSDPSVASVDASTGRIRALAVGECTITVETYNGQKGQCRLTVVPAPQSIQLSAPETVIGVGETMQLTKLVLPEGANGTTTYKSSRSSVLSVDADGRVRAKRRGSATITATCYNGVRARLKITVRRAPKRIELTASRAVVGVGERVNLSARLTKNSAGSYAVASSDEAVLSVSGGVATANAAGSATVTATTFNGKRASVEITVRPAPTSVSVADVTVGVGSSVNVQAAVNAGSAGALCYSVEDPAIASVDSETGRLTAKSVGTTRVTARAYNGVSATATVTVRPVPTYVRFPEKTVYVGVGDRVALHPEYDPGCETTLTYKTSKKKYATVSADGTVKGVRVGKSTITVKTHNGLSAKVQVVVRKAPKSMKLNCDALTLGVGETGTIGAALTANSMTTLRYEPSNPAVVSVDASGRLLGVSEGESEVTVWTHNGLSAKLRVSVKAAPSAISLSAPAELGVGQQAQLRADLSSGSASGVRYSVVSGSAVSVDDSGMLKAVSVGTAVVRASTYVPGVYADQTVSVYAAPKSVSLPGRYELNVGEQLLVVPTIDAGARAGFFYSVKAGSGFSVDANGCITGLSRGSGQIQVRTHNGLTAVAEVVVSDPRFPQSATFGAQTPAMLSPGETYTPVVVVTPASAQGDFVWQSSNPAIARVDSATGTVTAVSSGAAAIRGVSTRNGALSLSYTLVVASDTRTLRMPERRTAVDDAAIRANLERIGAVEQSAYEELRALYENGTISRVDYEKRRSIVKNAFAMYAFPWITEQYVSYWKAANSENGAKDYKPDTVYYGLPYTQTNRNYNVDKALAENRYLSANELYYVLNTANLRGGTYCGNDCSSFVSAAIWGMNSSHSSDRTNVIARTSAYKTVSSPLDLRPGDLLNRSSSHVVMFLYYADAAKTQMVLIEQGGGGDELGINTCICAIRDISAYTDNQYKIRRLASLK